MRHPHYLLSAFLTLSVLCGEAQTPGNPITLSAGTREKAYFPCDFSPIAFTHEPYNNQEIEMPPDYCPYQPIVPHYPQWIGFIPQSSIVHLTVEAIACQWDFGIQVGVWKAPDEGSPDLQPVEPCQFEIPPQTPTQLYYEGLEPGALYYFVFDGFDGDVCEINMYAESGLPAGGPLVGETALSLEGSDEFQICRGVDFSLSATPVFNANAYTWTVDGEVVPTSQPSIELQFDTIGSYEACVTPSNTCTGEEAPTVCETITAFDLSGLTIPQDTQACGTFVLPPIMGSGLTGNEHYYLQDDSPPWQGTPIPAGTLIDTSASLVIFNGVEHFCGFLRYFDVEISEPFSTDTLAGQIGCNFFVFPAPDTSLQLPPVTYYSAPNGNGTIFLPGDTTFNSGTFYRRFEQGACTTEQAFEVELAGQYCPDGLARISGYTAKPDGTPVSGTQMALQSFYLLSDTTDGNGQYAFDSIPGGFDYMLKPSRPQGVLDGIDLSDAFAILRHVYGLQTFYGSPETPYLLIAADVNSDQAVTVADFAIVRNTFLGFLDTFPNAPSWRFVLADFTFSAPGNPWLDDFPEQASFPGLQADTTVDFYALKIGDVDFTNTAEGLASAPAARLCLPNTDFKAGQPLSVPISVATSGLSGLQFELQYDTSKLSLASAQPKASLFPNQPIRERQAGHLPVMLVSTAAEGIPAGQALLTLKFTARQAGKTQDALYLNQAALPPLSLRADGRRGPLVWANCTTEVPGPTASIPANPRLQATCQPNPFAETAWLHFQTPIAGPVEIQAFSQAGKLVKRVQQYYEAGAHQMGIEDWLPQAGSYLITISNKIETVQVWAVRL